MRETETDGNKETAFCVFMSHDAFRETYREMQMQREVGREIQLFVSLCAFRGEKKKERQMERDSLLCVCVL